MTVRTLHFTSEFATLLPELSVSPRVDGAAPEFELQAIELNHELAAELELPPGWLDSDEALQTLAGVRTPVGAQPVAQVYAGHQWGVFKPVLGDGRAQLLGEIDTPQGRYDVHLKGTGPTQLSRVDGWAAVGPMLREFLVSEAMHALGVPTTRSLAVIATGQHLERDGVQLPGAVLARVARSHLRFGSFQYVPGTGDLGLLRRLGDHAIQRLYPDASRAAHPYRALFASIASSHARLTADWMRLGFVHGVLSTDNVTISGETIDYGPCAFIDRYDPAVWYSSIDEHGRYAYERQPEIMAWNLARLGDALAPLLGETPAEAQQVIDDTVQAYIDEYAERRLKAFTAKLGLRDTSPAQPLIERALRLLAAHSIDFTSFWVALADAADGNEAPVREAFAAQGVAGSALLDTWLAEWRALQPSPEIIRSVNPRFIPRNHLLDAALEAANQGDFDAYRELLEVVRHPYAAADAHPAKFAEPGPDLEFVTFCGT